MPSQHARSGGHPRPKRCRRDQTLGGDRAAITYGYDSTKDVTRLYITTYQTLPLAGHHNLLRFIVPASARVDHTPASYWHAAGLPRAF
jgi:hypothetical protein